MCDLDQFRGKRAILLGLPLTGRGYKWWRKSADTAVKTLGLEYADEWFGNPAAVTLHREIDHLGMALVLITGRRKWPVTKALGLPVLRVRRDGGVEVDDG